MPSPDVIIVGGGVIGCSIALRLAQAGLNTLIIEKSFLGAEASTAAAGMLAPQLESEHPSPFTDLCIKSRSLYPAFAEELRHLTGRDVGYLPCGAFHLAFAEEELRKQAEKSKWQLAQGYRNKSITRRELLEAQPQSSDACLGALHFPDEGQVDPRLLMEALVDAVGRAGVSTRVGEVQALLQQGTRCTGVEVDHAPLYAAAVVVAAGAWSSCIAHTGLSAAAVAPLRGQMALLEMPERPFTAILASNKGYVVPRGGATSKVLAGSTMEFAQFEKRLTAGGLSSILRMAIELSPKLAFASVVNTWVGLRPTTPDHLPILGSGPIEGLLFATGHHRNGVLLAPITAEIVADIIVKRISHSSLTPFRWDRFQNRR